MENYFRKYWEYNQRRSSNNKRPPPGGIWQRTVPAWEKRFCKEIGSMDWGTFLNSKKFTNIYEGVNNWDDSAAKETFHNEKERYWAKINGLPCDIPLPDPDLYIDEIDWDNSEIDPKLLADLENTLVISSTEENQEDGPVVIFGDAIHQTQWVHGWGDEESFKVQQTAVTPDNMPPATGWGDEESSRVPATAMNNNMPPATGWGDEESSRVPATAMNNNMPPATGWGDEESSRVPATAMNNNMPPATGWGSYSNAGRGSWNNASNDNNNNFIAAGWGGHFMNVGRGSSWNNNNINYPMGRGYGYAPNNNRGGRVQGNDRYRSRNYHKGQGTQAGGVGKRRNQKGWDIFTPYGGPVNQQQGPMPPTGKIWRP